MNKQNKRVIMMFLSLVLCACGSTKSQETSITTTPEPNIEESIIISPTIDKTLIGEDEKVEVRSSFALKSSDAVLFVNYETEKSTSVKDMVTGRIYELRTEDKKPMTINEFFENDNTITYYEIGKDIHFEYVDMEEFFPTFYNDEINYEYSKQEVVVKYCELNNKTNIPIEGIELIDASNMFFAIGNRGVEVFNIDSLETNYFKEYISGAYVTLRDLFTYDAVTGEEVYINASQNNDIAGITKLRIISFLKFVPEGESRLNYLITQEEYNQAIVEANICSKNYKTCEFMKDFETEND